MKSFSLSAVAQFDLCASFLLHLFYFFLNKIYLFIHEKLDEQSLPFYISHCLPARCMDRSMKNILTSKKLITIILMGPQWPPKKDEYTFNTKYVVASVASLPTVYKSNTLVPV